MAPSIKHLSACVLLALGALAAVVILYSGKSESGVEKPAVGPESSAVDAEKSPAAAEDPDPVEEQAVVVPEPPEVAPGGPILLPLNPPYMNAPIENEAAPPAIEPPQEAATENRQQSRPTERGVAEDQPTAEELLAEKLTALRKPPLEDVQPAEEQPAEDVQPAEEQPQKELVEQEGPLTEEQSAQPEELTEEDQPSELADGSPPEKTTESALPEVSPPSPPPPKRELTPAQVALRDRIRRTVAFHRGQALSASENTATDVLHSCLAFGCNTQIYRSGSSGQKVNGITCLCWNYPCAGYELLGLSEGRIAARIGYGLQEHPSQLLAVLALSRVKPDYPVRVDEDVRTVADLVEYQKLSCRSGTDQSLKLIGLTYYVGDETTWENSLGQQWSVERIIRSELDQPLRDARCEGTHRLMGLSYAIARREQRGQPLEGQFARARKLLDQYHDYALELQNSDGSWGPQFLAAGGTSRNQAAQLRSTGHVLEWLVMSLPADRLEDPRVVRSVEYVNSLLGGQRYRRSARSLSSREIGSVMHALHALAVYDERFFRPSTQEPSAPGVANVARKASSS